METFKVSEKNHSWELLNKLIFYFSCVVIFLIPLFFLPLTPNYFEFNKFQLLFFASVFAFILLILRNFLVKKFTLWSSGFDLPVFLFFLAYLLSSLIASSNRFLPFFSSTGIILSLTLFYFVFNQISLRDNRSWLQALMASSFTLGWLAVFAYLQSWPPFLKFDFLKSQTFTPTGDYLSLFIFQLVILPAIIIYGLKSKNTLNKIVYFLIAVINLISIGLIISLIWKKTLVFQFLPYSTGWWIATEIFKNAKTLFFGFGPESFLRAFFSFRPVSYNTTPYWSANFNFSSNYYLHLLTTTGVFGLLALFAILFSFAKKAFKKNPKDDIYLISKPTLILFILIFLAVPVGFLPLFVFYIFLLLLAQKGKKEKILPFNNIIKVFSLLALLLLLVLAYFQGRIWLAEKVFFEANKAAAENRGGEVYNKIQQAIRLNPFQEKYRIFFSQVSWALANSLAAKKDITDEERQQVVGLISQSITELKSALALNPQNALYWQLLAEIYRGLINSVNDAQNWAVASYAQAIRTDPVNPTLRLNLGGLFYSLGNYEAAIDQFKRAIELKGDYANAYYNLSWAYKQNNNLAQAYAAMQQVLALIPADSDDYKKASQELEEIKALLPKETSPAGSEKPKEETKNQVLTKPSALPSSLPTGSLKLPEEAQPEVNPETVREATMSAQPSPSASPEKSAP